MNLSLKAKNIGSEEYEEKEGSTCGEKLKWEEREKDWVFGEGRKKRRKEEENNRKRKENNA